MYPIIHQANFSLQPGNRPQRIVSLVPSQTEMLHFLGLDERVIGITDFCVHPAHWQTSKEKIGGTKKVDVSKVKALEPDLIIANKEENVKEQVEALASFCPVYLSDIHSLSTALEMMLQVGLLVQAKFQSEELVHQIAGSFDQLSRFENIVTAAYLIWQKPYMAAASSTFIGDMLERCGFQNVFTYGDRYPETSVGQLKELSPQVLLLSSEPFPFQQKHVAEWQAQLPGTKVLLVDGEMFSWYGSRMLSAPAYFTALQQRLV
jgi:ABC-type Fe3+-hydroxamate transport system substrate-binding protein